jgi:hypothetical protein
MTHVTIERAKAQRITDAFEDLKKNHGIVYAEESVDLKQALAAPVQEPVQSRCANCGKVSSDASEILSDYPEDGEWFCSTECRDQHNELDCPHLTHNGYRHPVESAKLIECERIMRELASWLGCGGYNADEFIPSEFKAKIRHGIEHLYPPAAQPAPAQEPVALHAMAKRRIFDAIRGAYDLGYNDARGARAVHGDSAPGYKGRDVEADHGGALFSALERYTTPPAAQPAPSHPDDLAVDRFAAAMKAKMAKQRAKGYGGWDEKDECSTERLQTMLAEHLAKGDPVDVGNFAMMLWNRGESTTPPAHSITKGKR